MIDEITFQDELSQPTINIPRAALRLARSIAYPILDVEFYLSRLNAMVESARPQVDAATTLQDQVDKLSDFLFGRLGFSGNRSDYSDPRNSYLNCVLDRKLGIPITLSMIYISLAQRLGINAYGIGLPGHFIVGVYQDGTQLMLDPYNAGARLSLADCCRLVRESTNFQGAFHQKWLAPTRPADILARMLTNLCNAYIEHENWRSAIPVLQHMIVLQPNASYHLRDLGYLYLYNGSLRQSAQYLEEYLRRAAGAPDFESVRSSLQIVAGRLALWN